jgi:hypothetical protein
MEKEFVPYELAVKLKAIGFDEPCLGYYHVNDGYTKGYAFCYFDKPKFCESDTSVLAPTFSQAFRWFREKFNIESYVDFCGLKYDFEIRFQRLADGENPPIMVYDHLHSWSELNLDLFLTHEEAEKKLADKLIEIVETKQQEQ